MKKHLQKYLPNAKDLEGKYRILRIFGSTILHPNLWKFSRQGFSLGVANGLFWCLIPIPFQMILAASSSIFLRSNLPVSLVLCWITNPITMPAIYYFTYRFGVLLLGETAIGYQTVAGIESISGLLSILGELWLPLYLGSFILALVFASSGYFLTFFVWKMLIIRQWMRRKHNRVRSNNR